MSTPTLRGTPTRIAASASATSCAIAAPTGTTTDDVSYFYVGLFNHATPAPTMSGGNGTWNLVDGYPLSLFIGSGTIYYYLFEKRCTSSDASTTYTASWTGATSVEGWAISWSGIPTNINPIEALHSADVTSANTVYQTVAVAVADPDPGLMWIGDDAIVGNHTAPTNFTEQLDGGEYATIATRFPAAAGSYTTSGGTGTHSGSGESKATLIALRSAVPAVEFLSQGAPVAGTTSITTAAYGTGWADGDLAVCVVASNHTTEATEPTAAGFTNQGTLNGGGGTQGAGTGNRRLTFFTRTCVTGDDTTPTVSLSTGNVMVAAITILRKDPALTWATFTVAFGAETTAGTGWSEAMTTNPTLDATDVALLACAVRDTSGSGAENITATGATFGTVNIRAALSSETGNDIALHVATCAVLTGPSSAAPTRTATHSTSETGVAGVLRIRAIASAAPALPIIVMPPRRP